MYCILGNTVADETAKLTNRHDISPLVNAATAVRTHSHRQIQDLLQVFRYLIDLNVLHINLKLEKEARLAEENENSGVDAYSSVQTVF